MDMLCPSNGLLFRAMTSVSQINVRAKDYLQFHGFCVCHRVSWDSSLNHCVTPPLGCEVYLESHAFPPETRICYPRWNGWMASKIGICFQILFVHDDGRTVLRLPNKEIRSGARFSDTPARDGNHGKPL